jgi:hypothetical protein
MLTRQIGLRLKFVDERNPDHGDDGRPYLVSDYYTISTTKDLQ